MQLPHIQATAEITDENAYDLKRLYERKYKISNTNCSHLIFDVLAIFVCIQRILSVIIKNSILILNIVNK